MRPFVYDGPIPASKSEVARALILASYAKEGVHKPVYFSGAEDVRVAERCVSALAQGAREFDCADSATFFRFFALRVSRVPGHFTLKGSEALLARPHEELLQILGQFGVKAWWTSDFRGLKTALNIESSQGWQRPNGAIEVRVDQSSQFVSALALNAWGLKFAIKISWQGTFVSRPYFDLSLKMARSAGALIAESSARFVEVNAPELPSAIPQKIEGDWSSAFFVFAMAALRGKARITNLDLQSSQPDARGLELLEGMGASVIRSADGISVSAPSSSPHGIRVPAASRLQCLNADLSASPDLFPVLACLAATAQGVSALSGLRHLQFKESPRQKRIVDLLKSLGVSVHETSDCLEITGSTFSAAPDPVTFDPRPDHRLVMAAAVLKAAGANVELLFAEAIAKSFPEFLISHREWLT